jgi:acyl-CoA synthetase (NDP forming)
MKYLPEHKSKDLLERYGIKTAKCIPAQSEDDAIKAARKIGFPVVMKIFSEGLVHKSDVGGVILDLRNEDEVREAFRRLMEIEGVEGVNVQPMLERGVEVIIGVFEDKQFGKAIMFGLGGIFVEIYNDVSFRILPITEKDAEEMIREVRGYRILDGYRGFKADVEALIKLIVRISEVAEGERIKEMDLNPVFVYERGYAVADARIWKA